jgi:hypothetical protein
VFWSLSTLRQNSYLTFSVFGLTAVADEGISGTGGTLRKDFFKEEYILNNAIGTVLKIYDVPIHSPNVYM